jgi:hypothetical protein
MRTSVHQLVPVRGTAAQVAALLTHLGRHRCTHPDPGPRDLPLRLDTQLDHQLIVALGLEIDPSTDLRHPQLHAVMLKQRCHQAEPAAIERPLVLPHHDRVEAAVGIGHRRHQRRGQRPPRPRQNPALPDIEILGHDPPIASN